MNDGIYFGLPMEEYHAAEALSASGVKNIRMSPLDFWARSWMNPKRDEDESEDSIAQMLGTAYHKRILEGRSAFAACYAPSFAPADGIYLDTVEDLRNALRTHEARVGGNKAELITRLLEIEPNTLIFDVARDGYEKMHAGKTFLHQDTLDRIELAAAMIEKSPTLGKAFTGGMPEVSVFWTCYKTGIRCKARFDYLKPKAIVDLKTVGAKSQYPFPRTVEREIVYNRYPIQVAWYYEAADYIAEFVREGKVSWLEAADDKFHTNYMRALQDNHEKTFVFVMQQKGIAPIALGRSLPRSSTHVTIAAAQCDTAKGMYKEYMEKFGTDPWLTSEPIEVLDDANLPSLFE